jgi:hypothetical protein
VPLSRNIHQYHGRVEWFTCRKEVSEEDRLKMVIFAQEELGKGDARWKAILLGLKIVLNGKVSRKDQ